MDLEKLEDIIAQRIDRKKIRASFEHLAPKKTISDASSSESLYLSDRDF